MKKIFQAAVMVAAMSSSAFAGLVNQVDAHSQEQPLQCDEAAARADHLEESILDLKARYWAQQLRNGAALAAVLNDPASSFSGRELRARFLTRLQGYYAAQAPIPSLSPAEVRQFVAADEEAFSLNSGCRL